MGHIVSMSEHPVRKAAFNDDVKLMEFLMSTSYDMNSEIWFGQTAFHVACDYGSKKVAKLIMESSGKYGIDLNAKADYGKTPFHLACKEGKTELVKLMIESSRTYGIDLNAGDTSGCTPFHEACGLAFKKQFKYFWTTIKSLVLTSMLKLKMVNLPLIWFTELWKLIVPMNLTTVMKSIPWKNWLICCPKVCLNKKYFKM